MAVASTLVVAGRIIAAMIGTVLPGSIVATTAIFAEAGWSEEDIRWHNGN